MWPRIQADTKATKLLCTECVHTAWVYETRGRELIDSSWSLLFLGDTFLGVSELMATSSDAPESCLSWVLTAPQAWIRISLLPPPQTIYRDQAHYQHAPGNPYRERVHPTVRGCWVDHNQAGWRREVAGPTVATGDHIPSCHVPKRTGPGVDLRCFKSAFHSPETLGWHCTFSSLLMFRVEVLQVMEGMGSPEASQVRVTCSSSSMAVWFST